MVKGQGLRARFSAGSQPIAPRAAKVPIDTYHWHVESSSLPSAPLVVGEPPYILVGAAGRGRLSGRKRSGSSAPEQGLGGRRGVSRGSDLSTGRGGPGLPPIAAPAPDSPREFPCR